MTHIHDRTRFTMAMIGLTAVAALTLPVSVHGQLLDNFDARNDDGWTHVDLLKGRAGGPTIYDARSGEYLIASTGPIPPQSDYVYTIAYWTASVGDPMYSDGYLRSKVRANNSSTHMPILMRLEPELVNCYAFGVNQYLDIVAILRVDAGDVITLETVAFVFDPGRDYNLEAGARGPYLSVKVWAVGEPEPEDPQVTLYDATYAVGAVGLAVSYIPGGPAGVLSGYFDDVCFASIGDLNCDGDIDALDIEPFIIALFEPGQYASQYPECEVMLGDINGDDDVDALDIEPFLDLLFP